MAYACVPCTPVPPAVAARSATQKFTLRLSARVALAAPAHGLLTAQRFQQRALPRFFRGLRRLALGQHVAGLLGLGGYNKGTVRVVAWPSGRLITGLLIGT